MVLGTAKLEAQKGAETDFGQTDFGPTLIGRLWSNLPRGGFRREGAERVGPRRVGAQNFAFFFSLSRHRFALFVSWGSSRGFLVVFLKGVASNVHVWSSLVVV